MKKKSLAGLLAIIFGAWGVHRFYLGQRWRGMLQFGLSVVLFIMTVETDMPFIMIPVMLAMMDAILFFAMPKEEFDAKFNRYSYAAPTAPYARQARHWNDANKALYQQAVTPKNDYRASGLAKYRDYDIDGAIHDFKKALQLNYQDAAIHFNLACCYSINEDSGSAIFHLDKSIAFGFNDTEKIQAHPALAYLRIQPVFEHFVANNYRLPAAPQEPEEEFVPSNSEQSGSRSLLQQIASLGELREKGILTAEEFVKQKQRILSK